MMGRCKQCQPLLALLLLLGSAAASFNSSFEGGNVIARWASSHLIEYQGALVCGPASTKCSPYDNWVYFSIDNVSTTTPTTLKRVGSLIWASPPYFSYTDSDTGADWLRFSQSDGRTTTHTFNRSLVYIAFSIPYVRRQRDRLFADLQQQTQAAKVQVFNLTMSEAGHAVSAVNISSASSSNSAGRRALIWFQARQHAWESGSSWLADGVARFAAGSAGASLLEFADVVVVPIMDIDNVVVGGAGKDQLPVDFNRDWCPEGEVAFNETGAKCQHWHAVSSAIATIRSAMGVSAGHASGGSGGSGAGAGASGNGNGRYTDLLFIDSHSPGNPKEPAQVWTECETGPTAVSPTAWSRIQAYKYLLKTHGAGCGRLTYDYWCAEVGPAYGNSHSGYHSNFISFMHLFYHEYAQLMNRADGRSMSYSHETSSATVAEAHCYGTAIGTAWTAILQSSTPVKPPNASVVPVACTGYPSSCHSLPPTPSPSPPSPTPHWPQRYSVSGAGSPACDGNYSLIPANERRGRGDKDAPMYQRDGEGEDGVGEHSQSHQIYRLYGRWHLAHWGVAVFYDAPNATGDAEVPTQGWVAMQFPNRTGAPPAPAFRVAGGIGTGG
eukprot:g1416.t1